MENYCSGQNVAAARRLISVGMNDAQISSQRNEEIFDQNCLEYFDLIVKQ